MHPRLPIDVIVAGLLAAALGCGSLPNEPARLAEPAPVVAGEEPTSTARHERFDEAHRAYEAGSTEEALAHFERITNEDPRDAEAWRWLAHCWTKLGVPERALEACERALVLDDRDRWPHYARAMALLEIGLRDKDRGAIERALTGYARSIEIDPRWPKSHDWRGFALAVLGRHAEALASFDRSLALDPSNAWTWFQHGSMRLATGDLAGARADVARARELFPALPPDPDRDLTQLDLDLAAAWLDLATGHDVLALDGLRTWCASSAASQSQARIAIALLEARAEGSPNAALMRLRDWLANADEPGGFELRTVAFVCGEGDVEAYFSAAAAEEEARAGPPLFGDAVRCEAEYYAGARAELEGRVDDARAHYSKCAAWKASAKWEHWFAARALVVTTVGMERGEPK